MLIFSSLLVWESLQLLNLRIIVLRGIFWSKVFKAKLLYKIIWVKIKIINLLW
jgi:hypothetical protein